MLYLVSPYYGFFSYLNACALKSISHPRNAHMHPYTHCISAVFVCQSATISSCGFAAITPNNKKNCYRITEIPTSESKRQGVRKESLPLFHNVFFFFWFLRNLQQIGVSCACLPKPNAGCAPLSTLLCLCFLQTFALLPLTLVRQTFDSYVWGWVDCLLFLTGV